MPIVWASTDHQCIVWCKQVVFSVVRALFDMVEFRKRNRFYSITEDLELKKTILEYHFVKVIVNMNFLEKMQICVSLNR